MPLFLDGLTHSVHCLMFSCILICTKLAAQGSCIRKNVRCRSLWTYVECTYVDLNPHGQLCDTTAHAVKGYQLYVCVDCEHIRFSLIRGRVEVALGMLSEEPIM